MSERNSESQVNYEFNVLYLCLIIFVYNIWHYNYVFILLDKIYNNPIMVIYVIGLLFVLNKISFEINITWSIKYK